MNGKYCVNSNRALFITWTKYYYIIPQATLIGPPKLIFCCTAQKPKGILTVFFTHVGGLLGPTDKQTTGPSDSDV